MGLLRIVADTREAPSGIPRILGRRGMYVQMKTLDIGDYVIGEYVVERKTIQDFLSSLYGGRLFEQAQRIMQSYDSRLMIVEGDLQQVLSDLKNPTVFWGALVTLGVNMDFKVFFTLDQEQTADFLYVLASKAYRRGQAIRPVVVRKPRLASFRDRQLSVLQSLPTIGPKLAEKLLTSFGSVRRVMAASSSELSLKGGIGYARARKIRELLDAEYRQFRQTQAELPRL